MQKITEETLAQIQERQPSLWTTVSETVAAACSRTVEFVGSEPAMASASSVTMGNPGEVLAIQFEFSHPIPNSQLFLIKAEEIKVLCKAVIEGDQPEDEESAIPELRPFLEAIVQGLCTGFSTGAGNALIASDLAIRLHALALPTNMEGSTNLCEIPVAITVEGQTISGKWLADAGTISIAFGKEEDGEQSGDSPFETLDSDNVIRLSESNNGLERLMDIPLEVSVELGRVKMLVRDVVDLGSGSVIEVNKSAGEPVDVLVNGRLVARGEVIIIEDNFGVRITEILNRMDRLNRLSEVS